VRRHSEIDTAQGPLPEEDGWTAIVLRTPPGVTAENRALGSRAWAEEVQAASCAERGFGEQSIQHLRQALSYYDEIGSSHDSARVRLALRGLGVRVRHWTYEHRARSGWQSLTATEKQISELVALGLTNREVAAEMFISLHTVGFHLRQVFRKLAIRSRVELTRLAVEHERSPKSA
jgi:DNA-binding CsgD family transcriptional regulator